MVTISAPLIAAVVAAAIPLVWWLHRRRTPEITAVPALFLWQAAAAHAPIQRAARRTDPIWMLRAAVCAALLLALAGIGWRSTRPLTVWVDDSLSMLAEEPGGTRVRLALRRVFELAGDDGFVLRLLRDPAAVPPDGGADALAGWLESRLPDAHGDAIAPPLDPQREHWLVTDGARESARRLLADGRFHRRVLVGEQSENVAVTSLALRRALRQPERYQGLVRVANLGREEARRTLTVRGGGNVVLEQTLHLPPGQQLSVWFEVAAGTGQVTASLAESDALAADDSLSAGLGALARLRVLLSGTCPAALVRALGHHPGIRLEANAPHDLVVACGSSPPAQVAAKVIRVHQGQPYQPTSSLLAWMDGGVPLAFLARPLQRSSGPRPDRDADVLLRDFVGGDALVTAGPDGLDVYLDLGSGAPPEAADYLALVDGILTAATGESRLDPVIERSRSPADSRIAPYDTPRPAAAAAAPLAPPADGVDLTGLLIALASVLLAVDTVTARGRRDPSPRRRRTARAAAAT